MRIDNPKLLAEFRKKARCEWCGVRSDTGRDPAHIICRGAGGPDIRCNLLSLCRACHSESHAGDHPSYFEMLDVASRRENVSAEAVEDVVNLIRNIIPKGAPEPEIEAFLAACSPAVELLARKELTEAGKIK
jgi:hypothetical protein